MNIFKQCFIFSILLIGHTAFSSSHHPTTLFCHGMADNKDQINLFNTFILEPKQSFDFPDAEEPTGWNFNKFLYAGCKNLLKRPINVARMGLGYTLDIQTIKKQVNPDKNYILYGLSRGGVAIINYLAEYNPCNIVGVVLDCAPADMLAMLERLQYELGYKFAPTRSTQETIVRALCPAYPLNSISTLENMARIKNKNLPILIVHSYEDTRVHISSAWQLYVAFLQAEFDHVYLCQLNHGEHGICTLGQDKDFYLHALHSFYKAHNFPYEPAYADLNMQEFQPSIASISEKLIAYMTELERRYEQKQKRVKFFLTSIAVACFSLFTFL